MRDYLRWLVTAAATIFALCLMSAQANDVRKPLFVPISTDSPRATLNSIQLLSAEIAEVFASFRDTPSARTEAALTASMQRLVDMFDLSMVAPIERREKGILAAATLVDVLKYASIQSTNEAPDAETETVRRWTVPGTEITLALVEEGQRKGEYLIDSATVERLENYSKSPEARELMDPNGWAALAHQLHGWMIPAGLISALPEVAFTEVLGDPIWKTAIAAVISLLTIGAVLAIHRLTWPSVGTGPVASHVLHLITPLAIVVGTYLYVPLIQEQVFMLGDVSILVDVVAPLTAYFGLGWLAWHIIFVLAELGIRNPRISSESLDANLMRLGARILAIAAVVLCAVKAAEGFGVPVVGIAAGLGAGGLAFGLAAQGTIENLIGALTIYFDRPLAVGDYCRVADIEGNVQSIGLRSTIIRKMDRTSVAIPNSLIVKNEIHNFSRRDTYLFKHQINLSLELSSNRIKEISDIVLDVLLQSNYIDVHAPIAPRAPIVSFGEWAIHLEVLSYISARDYAEFLMRQSALISQIISAISARGEAIAVPQTTVNVRRAGSASSNQGS